MTILTFTPSEKRIFAKRTLLPVSRWASRNLIIQDGPYAGSPLRLDVAPYLAGPMDAFSTPGVEEVGFCGSLQIGKTLFLYACLGYSMDFRPGPKMIAMPTKESRDNVIDKKLNPLIAGSPVLKKLVLKTRRQGADLKDGSGLIYASAESASSRASITIQDLFMDEEDLYMPSSATADPVSDFRGRTRSYGWRRKIARTCQPKGENSSIFAFVTKDADQLFCYELCCPDCNKLHLPHISNIVLSEPADDPRLVRRKELGRYMCPDCGSLWTDHLRDIAVSKGRWAPYVYTDEQGFKPSIMVRNPKRVGFHAWSVISRTVSLSHIAAQKILADTTDDEVFLRQYHNDELALPYTATEVLPQSDIILSKNVDWLPKQVVPHGAVAITLGVDMQKHGFWFLAMAWMPDLSAYIIDNGFLDSWEDLHNLCYLTQYPVQNSGDTGAPSPGCGHMTFWRCGLDTGGGETDGVYTRPQEAYLFIREHGAGFIHAIKGASRAQASPVMERVIDRMPGNRRPIPGGLKLHFLDTMVFKSVGLRRILDENNKHPIRLYKDPDPELGRQLSAEKLQRIKGRLKWVMMDRDKQNHYLDCLMINMACADGSWQPSLPLLLLQEKRRLEMEALRQQAPPQSKKPRDNRTRDRYNRFGGSYG